LVGLGAVLLLVGGVGAWAATAEIAGAVIASGSIVVETNVKKVQHLTGGIVGQILVQDGERVSAGQILVRLDETVTRATLGIVRSQLDELLSRQSRLHAEREGAAQIKVPDELSNRQAEPSVAVALSGERRLFESRRSTRAGQQSQLRERIGQIRDEVRGLTALQEAKARESKFISDELVGVTDLFQKNLISIQRIMLLRRDEAKLEGERAQLIADVARATGKITETELQIIQLDQDFGTEVLKDLRDVEGKVAELKERYVAAQDQLKRVDIRAPQDGVVHQLNVHTVGGVIGNGEIIMQIVPHSDHVVVDAKIPPQDVDQLSVGAHVIARVMAGNQRTTPEINGVLQRISADITRDQQTNVSYYTVRILLDDDEIRRLGELTLLPGMPVEAFIQTPRRTPLQYLLKPLRDQIARTFKER
jgi:HlyD family secretion protein